MEGDRCDAITYRGSMSRVRLYGSHGCESKEAGSRYKRTISNPLDHDRCAGKKHRDRPMIELLA